MVCDSIISALDAFKLFIQEKAVAITAADLVIVISQQVASLIVDQFKLVEDPTKPDVELWQATGFRQFRGIWIFVVKKLPLGVNYLLTTTGINGALHHCLLSNEFDQAKTVEVNINVVDDPNWMHNWCADVMFDYNIGVVWPERLFVSSSRALV